jgi:CRP-like cAMP-binding protein
MPRRKKRTVIQGASFEVDAKKGLESGSNAPAKSPASRQAIEAALGKHFLFKVLDRKARDLFVQAMERKLMAPGEQVIVQGKMGDTFFVMEKGEVSVSVNKKDVGVIKAPAAFGELALMYNSPRAATITCTEYGVLWYADRSTFRQTMALAAAQGSSGRREFLAKVPLLKGLSNMQMAQLAEAFSEVRYDSGEDIIVQGTEGSKFYVCSEGQVTIRKRDNPTAEYVNLVDLPAGSFFGERSLLMNQPRNATCTAKGPTVCLVLERAQFDQLLGPLKDILAQTTEARDDQAERKMDVAASGGDKAEIASISIAATAVTGPSGTRERSIRSIPKVKMARGQRDVEEVAIIGVGSMAKIRLVRHKKSGRLMAVKCFAKAALVKKRQVPNATREKICLAEVDSPFLVELLGTGQDKNSLFLLLEFVPGGELWSLLYMPKAEEGALPRSSIGGLENNAARWFASCVVSALEAIHATDYAYRDLKLENMMVDSLGYLKFVDFGFAKRVLPGAKTQTLCGTPEYFAPELVLSRGHDRAVDWWALGVLIFELLCGRTPFADKDQSKVFMRIVHSERSLEFPEMFPRKARDLIKKLLNARQSGRLGMKIGGAGDVRGHRWFNGVGWEVLKKKKYGAPWTPNTSGEADLRYFDTFESDDGLGGVEVFDGDDARFERFLA